MSNVDRFTLRAVAIGAVLLLLYLLWRIFQPFVGPILWAALLAFLLHPLNQRLRGRVQKKRGPVAILLTLAVVVAIVLPVTLLGTLFVKQAADLGRRVSELVNRYQIEKPSDLYRIPALEGAVHWIDEKTPITAAQVQGWLVDTGKSAVSLAVASSKWLFVSAVEFVVALLLMLFILYFFLRDGDEIAVEIFDSIPVEGKRKKRLVDQVSSVTRAVVYGSLLTSLVQGALIGLAFAVCGLPSPVVFGVVAAIASLLPVGGTAFVWLPGAIALGAQGRWVAAVGLAVWGALIVGSADNVLRPYFISGRASISTLPVFFGVLGGIAAFGPIGAVLGPVLIALALAILRSARDPETPAETGAAPAS